MSTPDNSEAGNGRVSYTVKELLANLEKKIAKLLEALEHKADLAQLTQVRKDVMTLDGRLKAVESAQETSTVLLQQVNKIIQTQDAVQRALNDQAENVQHKSDSAFNRKDKIVTGI